MKPCLVCGKPSPDTRCPSCQHIKDRARNARRTHYQHGWATLSRTTRQAWIAEHGMTCAGIPGHPPHPTTRLELDHTTGRVLCPQANRQAGPAGPTAAIPHPH